MQHREALMVLLAGMVGSRLVSQSGLKFLNTEQKALLVDGLGPIRYAFLAPLVIVAVVRLHPGVLLVTLLACMVATQAALFWKLHQMKLPDRYIGTIAASSLISLITISVFLFMVLSG